MEERGMTQDQIDTAMKMVKKYFMLFLVLGVILGTIIFGCIASLIGAAVAKKNKVGPFDQVQS